MAPGLHHHATTIANDPGFGFTKRDGFVDSIHIKGSAIDGVGDAHGLQFKYADGLAWIVREGLDGCQLFRQGRLTFLTGLFDVQVENWQATHKELDGFVRNLGEIDDHLCTFTR